jgi:hypothetical protein
MKVVTPDIDSVILTVRGQRVILDVSLAGIYGVQTRALNQAVKRNPDKFPPEFMLVLEREEILRISQSVTSFRKLRFSKQVRAFTEYGALMAATVLNSQRAVKMSLFIIRGFVKMREHQAFGAAVLQRLAEIDKTLLAHDAALRDIYKKLVPFLAPPAAPPKPEIGFHVKEESVPYRINRRQSRSP